MSDGSEAFLGPLIIGGAIGAFAYVQSNSTDQNDAYCHRQAACSIFSKARQPSHYGPSARDASLSAVWDKLRATASGY
jgi:hypothetical protein